MIVDHVPLGGGVMKSARTRELPGNGVFWDHMGPIVGIIYLWLLYTPVRYANPKPKANPNTLNPKRVH